MTPYQGFGGYELFMGSRMSLCRREMEVVHKRETFRDSAKDFYWEIDKDNRV